MMGRWCHGLIQWVVLMNCGLCSPLGLESTQSVMHQLLQNLPPLPASEITDPHDDITLPRLIEVLEKRHKIRQMMTQEYNRAGKMVTQEYNGAGRMVTANSSSCDGAF